MSNGSSDDIPDPKERKKAVLEFLDEKGAVGVLREVLRGRGSRFTELDEAVDVSSSTLTKRLNEAVELDLLEMELDSIEHGTATLYRFTDAGASVHDFLDRSGVFRKYDKIRTLEEELEDALEDSKTQIDELMYGGGPPGTRDKDIYGRR